jgi:hypothetical protein
MYEWDVEEVVEYGDDEDIIDHTFVDTAADAFRAMSSATRGEKDGQPVTFLSRMVLVCNILDDDGDLLERGWAYVEEDGTLPPHFEDAYLVEIRKVPQRFHDELAVARPTR